MMLAIVRQLLENALTQGASALKTMPYVVGGLIILYCIISIYMEAEAEEIKNRIK
jgi:hypothetical protein